MNGGQDYMQQYRNKIKRLEGELDFCVQQRTSLETDLKAVRERIAALEFEVRPEDA